VVEGRCNGQFRILTRAARFAGFPTNQLKQLANHMIPSSTWGLDLN